MNELRLFIAIDIDKTSLNKIEALLNNFKSYPFIRWTKRDTWHLTLKFLGQQKSSFLTDITHICESVKVLSRPFSLHLKSVNAFPSLKLPKILYINVLPEDNLTLLYNNLDSLLCNIGIPKENRAFSPHITIGRIKEPKLLLMKFPNFINTFVKEGEVFDHIIQVKEFRLYQSILKPSGPQYIILKNFELSGR